MIKRYARLFKKGDEGVTAIEFAIVAPVFFLLFFVIFEFGYLTFATVVLESATNITARNVRLSDDGGSGDLQEYVRAKIKALSAGLIDSESIIITTDSRSYDTIATAFETCLQSPAPAAGTCPLGPFIDNPPYNGVYDGVDSTALDITAPGALIRLNVMLKYTPFTFAGSFLTNDGTRNYVIQSTTYLKKEPA